MGREGDRDRAVVDAEKRGRGRAEMPLLTALAGRKPEQLKRMAVRIAEFESALAAIGARELLGAAPADWLPAGAGGKIGVGPVHVTHDDRQMLEPEIAALALSREGPALGLELHQGDLLLAEPHHQLLGGGALQPE